MQIKYIICLSSFVIITSVNTIPVLTYVPKRYYNTLQQCSANDVNRTLTIYVLTWNVHKQSPNDNLHDLFPIESRDNRPDIITVGLQEIPFNFGKSEWNIMIDRTLLHNDYVPLINDKIENIEIIAYRRSDIELPITSLETDHTRTGYSGLWGNKGAVSLRMKFGGITICIVNSHLPAHDNKLEERVNDYHRILKSHNFNDAQTPHIIDHNVIIWIGDLNFRLNDIAVNDAIQKIHDNNYDELLKYDQLRRVQSEGRAFCGFTEETIRFPPTYKFVPYTDTYAYDKRKPAYTDRILYRINRCKTNYDNFHVQQLSYSSVPYYKLSDHKPVKALFKLILKAK